VWDILLEIRRVLKRIPLSKEGQWEAAVREMAALGQIHREGIPVLADVFYEEGSVCLIMEYMRGVPLEEKVRREGPIEEREAVGYAVQAARLLHFLHTFTPGVIHGDLKPANLMLQGGKISLLDFGGAVFLRGQGWEGTGDCRGICYTPGYGAPELLKDGAISVRSDIYALGAVLFYLVTGERPDGVRGTYPIREQNPFFSSTLEAFLCKCMRQEPEERYGSMEQVLEALMQLLGTPKDRGKERGGMLFRAVKRVLLTEGREGGIRLFCNGGVCRAVVVLLAGILWGMAPAAQAAGEILPVNLRTREGGKLLVDYNATYFTAENPIFEVPLRYFEEGKEYEVTIRQRQRQGGEVRERTFVICAKKDAQDCADGGY